MEFILKEKRDLEELNECVNEFWLKNQLLIEKCNELIEKVNKHKSDCNIVRGVGTGVSGVGSVALISGVCLIPFTAGFSALLSISGGLVVGLGSLTSIGTEFADTLLSKKFYNELKEFAEERSRSALVLSKKLSQFDSFLVNDCGIDLSDKPFDDNTDGFKLFQVMAKGSFGAYKLGNNSVKLLEAIKELNAIKVAKSVKMNANLAKNVGKSALNLIPTEVKGVSSAVVRTTGVSGLKLTLKGASAVAGLVFTVIDAVSLIEAWNRTHPTVDAINNFISNLENDSKLIENIHSFIENIDRELIDQIVSSVNTTSYTTSQSDTTFHPSTDSLEDNEINFDFDYKKVFYNRLEVKNH